MAKVTFDADLCKGCGLCVDACPKGILQIAGAYSDYSDILHIAAIACLAIAVILYPVEIVLKKKTSIHTKE